MVETILKVKNIKKSFNDFKAVDDISFEVYKGEILGLLGPNGAGKTTVIRMIMGIFRPDSGEIEFDREMIINKQKIGYLPEERGIYDSTKVLDTILYFADLKGMDLKQAESEARKWLQTLGLKEFTNSKIEDLSKGMQQKVQFIISILHNPELLVLDEVFSGLDPVNQDLFKDIILKLAKSGATILLSSHRMNMVEELCDRIFMINHGQQLIYGQINKIKDNFGERKVKIRFKGDAKVLKEMSALKDLQLDAGVAEFNLHYNVRPERFLQALPDGFQIEELTIQKPSLHEVFINQVQGGGEN